LQAKLSDHWAMPEISGTVPHAITPLARVLAAQP
jgi:hypothetical protein